MNSRSMVNQQRTDMSRYLIHWTTRDGFWSIIRSGVLIATFAERAVSQDEAYPTIRGNKPAVCFGDVPIGNYLQSSLVLPNKYPRWAVAVLKTRLHEYGARPAIYADGSLLDALVAQCRACGRDERYLLVHYSPDVSDWMHEREWRVMPNLEVNQRIGLPPECAFDYAVGGQSHQVSGSRLVPIHLPVITQDTILADAPEFVLLVDTREDAERIAERQQGNRLIDKLFRNGARYASIAAYREQYIEAFSRAKVIDFEQIKDGRDRESLWRIEDFLATSTALPGVAALWDRASVNARREALHTAGITDEEARYCYYQWDDLQRSGLLLFPPWNILTQSQDVMQVLLDDVQLWAQTFLASPVGPGSRA